MTVVAPGESTIVVSNPDRSFGFTTQTDASGMATISKVPVGGYVSRIVRDDGGINQGLAIETIAKVDDGDVLTFNNPFPSFSLLGQVTVSLSDPGVGDGQGSVFVNGLEFGSDLPGQQVVYLSEASLSPNGALDIGAKAWGKSGPIATSFAIDVKRYGAAPYEVASSKLDTWNLTPAVLQGSFANMGEEGARVTLRSSGLRWGAPVDQGLVQSVVTPKTSIELQDAFDQAYHESFALEARVDATVMEKKTQLVHARTAYQLMDVPKDGTQIDVAFDDGQLPAAIEGLGFDFPLRRVLPEWDGADCNKSPYVAVVAEVVGNSSAFQSLTWRMTMPMGEVFRGPELDLESETFLEEFELAIVVPPAVSFTAYAGKLDYAIVRNSGNLQPEAWAYQEVPGTSACLNELELSPVL